MTLGELLGQTTKLLEEYTATASLNYADDSDIRAKIIDAVNTCIGEVSRVRAIVKRMTYTNDEEYHDLPSGFKSIKGVFLDEEETGDYIQIGNYDIFNGQIKVTGDGAVAVEYEAYPTKYTEETAKSTVLELDAEACEVLHYGVAKIVLMITGQGNDATECENKYYTLLQQLKPTVGARLKIHSIFGS